MADYTLQLIYQPSNHVALDEIGEAMRWRPGDIVDIWSANKRANFNDITGNWELFCLKGNWKFRYIHIKNVPDTITYERIKAVLTSREEATINPLPTQAVMFGTSPLIVVRRKRKWRVHPATLPQTIINRIQSEIEITIDYSLIKQYIKKKIVNDWFDRTQDDMSTYLTDGDISG